MLKKAIIAFTLFSSLPLVAESSNGENLEKQAWDLAKKQQWDELDKMIAPDFQLANFDVIINKDKYINHVKALNIKDYNLSDFTVTENNGVTVVTYNVAVTENVRGTPTSSKANRLSVWQNNNGQWQLIAHAVLIPVPPQLATPAKPAQ